MYRSREGFSFFLANSHNRRDEVGSPPCEAPFHEDILALHIAEVMQTLPKCPEGHLHVIAAKDTDPWEVSRWLAWAARGATRMPRARVMMSLTVVRGIGISCFCTWLASCPAAATVSCCMETSTSISLTIDAHIGFQGLT